MNKSKVQSRIVVKTPPEPQLTDHLAKQLKIDPILAALLVSRGIHTYDQAREFFNPNLDLLCNPFEMKDMREALDRLCSAIDKGEKILVYGDYDVDGTTAVAMVYSFLKSIHVSCEYYIPDRNMEGYGFSFRGVDFAKEQGISLIITLDCGIRDGDKVKKASEYGIDVIICDHHHPQDLPPALAVLDPHRMDCDYPYKGLSGCGVGFKLLQAYCMEKKIDLERLYCYLDLLTISIGADIVPITGENRILAFAGLQRLSESRRPGVKAILEQAAFRKRNLSISDVVFILAPRINAAGRIVSGNDAVRLLLEGDVQLALKLSEGIEQNNVTRKALDKSITAAATGMVNENIFYNDSFATVVYHEDWHKGVVGIVAARLVETYYKPAIVLTGNKGKLSGSARSIPGIDLFQALEQCDDLLEQFGGHTMAAGLTLETGNFELFRDKFDHVVATMLGNQKPVMTIETDAEIDFTSITPLFFRILQRFEPFGPGNMNPLFLTRRVVNAGQSKIVGSDNSHLKLDVIQIKNPEIRVNGIGFGFANTMGAEQLFAGKEVDIVYALEPHEWNNQVTIQMQVKDIRPSE